MTAVEAALATMQSEAAAIADDTTDAIRREVPGYAHLPLEAHRREVQRQTAAVLRGLGDRSEPGTDLLEHLRAMGGQRAAEGIGLADVIEAYHIAYRETWGRLVATAQVTDPTGLRELIELADPLWAWFHRVCGVVAEGHSGHTSDRASVSALAMRRLVDALRAPGAATAGRPPEVQAQLAVLGLDADGDFLFVIVPESEAADRLAHEVAGPGRRVAVLNDGDRTTLLVQGADDDAVGHLVTRALAGAPAGVGIRRAGVTGAAQSLRDADEAWATALELGRPVLFSTSWLSCLVTSAVERLEPVLGQAMSVARRSPDLAATVTTYAGRGFSVSAAARDLHIHPNTAMYRLRRWCELTGWDPRTHDGLTASLAAIERADGEPHDHGRVTR